MPIWQRWFGGSRPRAAAQSSSGGVLITSSDELDRYLRAGAASRAGAAVTPDTAMQVAAVYACVRIIAGAVATLPLHIKRRLDDRSRADASDTPLWQLLRRRPNRWQQPAQFRRMLQAHVLLRGNGYCLIVRSRGEVTELLPLNPERVKLRQLADLSLSYDYRRPDGGSTTYSQREILHLYLLTLDGISGVTPLTFARETVGLALAMEDHGAQAFKHGLRVGGVVRHPNKLSPAARDNLRGSLDEYRSGGAREGNWLILEEGMEPATLKLTAADMEWLGSRKFSRSEIAMFFGVPPHMIGDTEKSTSWGSGIEQQSIGFVAYTLEDHLTMWEEAITGQLAQGDLYARFNRAALVKGDVKARWDAYVKALQWGVLSPNEVRALEDENPRDGGDVYYPPPNTAGDPAGAQPQELRDDEAPAA